MAFRKPLHPPQHRSPARRAFTLVELLVVVAMLIILVGVLTTAMQPVLAGKEIREAARGLNSFIAASVARAAETGRPAGVWIQRQPFPKSNASLDVFFADVPPLYAGDTVGATATFNTATPNVVTLTPGQSSVDGFINVGDSIRFFYAGPWYEITDVSTAPSPAPKTVTYALDNKPAPPYGDGAETPFQIQRQPRPSPVQPFQMPANTIIDLTASGVGLDSRFASINDSQPVAILFNPDASLHQLYYWDDDLTGLPTPNPRLRSVVVLGTIHLLVGRADQLGPGNLASLENRWVSIGVQTGRVITTENLGAPIPTGIDADRDGILDPTDTDDRDLDKNGTPDELIDQAIYSRRYANAGLGMGGN